MPSGHELAGLAGRIGGDEFAVLLEDADAQIVEFVADQVIAALREPFAYENRLLSGSVSVGAEMACNVDAVCCARAFEARAYKEPEVLLDGRQGALLYAVN